MTDAVFGPILGVLGLLAVIGIVLVVAAGAVLAGPRLVGALRQRAYDRAAVAETVSIELVPERTAELDDATAIALVRGLHPQQRRGFDAWRVGWPSAELRAVWCDGALAWQVEAPRQLLAEFATAHRPLGAILDTRPVDLPDRPAVATAVGRLARSSAWPLRAPDVPGERTLHRLAAALEEAAPPGSEVRWRVLLRPIAPDAWLTTIDPEAAATSSIGTLVREAVVDGLLFRESGSGRAAPSTPSALERDARVRKRRGAVGFDVGLVIEVAGTSAEAARALLWRLTDATDGLADAGQQIRWDIAAGSVAKPPQARLADWEVAQLWYLPDDSFDRSDLPRRRPLSGALPPVSAPSAGIVIGANGDRPLAIPIADLARHLAVIGSTGSGKSTLLLNLVTGLFDTGWGATVVDPHGDLVTDILARVPARHADRVHVLRLADREHPRAFNFLECRSFDEAQLVTSEFVAVFYDLWPRFCGPRMQNIMRNALLTLLSDPAPQTVLELNRILSEDAFRVPYLEQATDPLLESFWRHDWPDKGASRDQSVGAVKNKLAAFITYDSIRQIVGQGMSTIRPRTIMDAGDVLLVDLSGVGDDNASIFGGLLINRYRIDALARQGTDPATRRPHLLVVDEAPRFRSHALGDIGDEGRKFGLSLGVGAQTLDGFGEGLRQSVVANAGTIALLSPSLDDAKALLPLFAPLTAADLLGMDRHAMAVRMAGPKGRDVVYGGVVSRPRPGDPAVAATIAAASDRRDARARDVVAAEVRRRLTRQVPKTGAESSTSAVGPTVADEA